MYNQPATKGWFNVSDAAVIVQGMLPSTCRVVVAEAVLLPRRVRGLLPATAKQDCLPEEAAPNYKTLDMHHFAPNYKTYAEASDTVRQQMERDAVVANEFRKNQTKVSPISFLSPNRNLTRSHTRTLTCKGMPRAWNSARRVSQSLGGISGVEHAQWQVFSSR